MIAVTARWKDSVGRSPQWVTLVEWTSDGQTWLPATYVAGSITESATSQVRWKTDGLIVEDVRMSDGLNTGGIDPYGCRVRLRVGLQHDYTTETTEWAPKGVYRVEEAVAETGSNLVALDGLSMEQQIIDARFEQSRMIGPGTRRSVIDALITEVIDDATISWRVDGSADVARVAVLRDRWSVIDGPADAPSLARAMGARVSTNGAGVWVVEPSPSLDDPALWEVTTGPQGVLVKASRSLSRNGVFNVVSATGVSTDEKPPPGPVIAKDTAPFSRTNADKPVSKGGFGRVTLFYASPQLTNTLECGKAAQTILAPRLGLKQQIDHQTLFDPSKEAGDVGLIVFPDGFKQKVIVDSITLDPAAATMTTATRTTTTRLAGELVSDEATDEEGVE